MSMRQKLGFRKENIITIFSFVLFVSVVVYAITNWGKIDYIQTSISLATLLTVLILWLTYLTQSAEFKKRDKENEKQKLKEEMEQILCIIVGKLFGERSSIMDKFKYNRLFFLDSVRIKLEGYNYESSPFKDTIEISKRYLRLEERFQQKFGGDENHNKIAQILQEKVPKFIENTPT